MKCLKNLWIKLVMVYKSWRNPGALTSSTYRKYPKKTEFKNMKVLNLGCGCTTYPSSNVVNLDMYPNPEIQVVHKLGKDPLPFKDNSFDLIIANHILEHVPDWWDCFTECARVLKDGGRLEVWLPADGGSSQLGYRDHINVINHCSFFGVAGTHRNCANMWESEQTKKDTYVHKLYQAQHFYTLRNYWWIHIWPDRIISWMVHYLRNIHSEEGFIFYKNKFIKPTGRLDQVNY